MPLKTKGKKDKSARTKKKNRAKGKEESSEGGGKKAMFAETVRKKMVKERVIDYKKCVVCFAIRVNKEKNAKGGFIRR